MDFTAAPGHNSPMRNTRDEILHFWFEESEPRQWFQVSDSFDAQIRDRFLVTYTMATEGLCDGWAGDAAGCLALCVLLDQFPRNMFRGLAAAFSTDAKALSVAKMALICGYDQMMEPLRRRFLYLPFEHSEDLADQQRSVRLFEAMKQDDPTGYEYALRHLRVIERFGRFPHRNAVLGRTSTSEEANFLQETPSGF